MRPADLSPRAPGSRTALARALVLAVAALLLGTLALVASASTGSAGATDDPSVSQPGTLPSVDETPSTSGSSPEATATYGEGGAGPHQESGEDQMGPLTPGRTVAILAIVAATLAVVVTLGVRSRRKRSVDGGTGRAGG